MQLPRARGPLSEALFARLQSAPTATSEPHVRIRPTDWLADDDLQITLWVLYELHYRSFDGISERWEWHPSLMQVQSQLEELFERALREAVADELALVRRDRDDGGDLARRFFSAVEQSDGPDMASWIQKSATVDQVRDFLTERSIYHLKEADPHTWVIPRISGRAKSALVELQFDEYGGGALNPTHAELFATTMREAGLDDTYGACIDAANAATLAANNAMSLFGLHRRLRGAAMGHLAAFEATSSLPCRRYAAGLRRVGFSERAAAYFDEHVEADAVHEQLAIREICATLVAEQPELEDDVFFGALACVMLDARQATSLFAKWDSKRHAVDDGLSVGVQ